MHGFGGLKGWQWLFIAEGLPPIALGVIVFLFLDDRPGQARWLLREEREALSSVPADEAAATREMGYHALGDALTKPRVLVLALIYFCIVIGLYGIGFWMPQVIQTFGLGPLAIGFLTAIPYAFASIGMVLSGARIPMRAASASGISRFRFWSAPPPFAWSATALPLSLMMVALSLAALGIYATIGTLWSLPTAILTGAGAAAGLALVNAVGNLGGLAGPAVIGVLKEALALLFLAGALSAGASIMLLFGRLAWTGDPSPCVIQ